MSTNNYSNSLRCCQRCSTVYTWSKSLSSLKMTYCNTLCEQADLGFTIDALINATRAPRVTVEAEAELSLSDRNDWVVLAL